MKKFRFLAFLCALVLLVSAMSFASAAKSSGIQTATVDNAMCWHSNRVTHASLGYHKTDIVVDFIKTTFEKSNHSILQYLTSRCAPRPCLFLP